MGDLVDMPHEDAAGPVDEVRFRAGTDQPGDLLLQAVTVDVALLVPDHEVDGQALQPPPGVRLDQLARQLDVVGVADLQQHDRQVARDAVAPQPRLPATVAQQHRVVGAPARLRVDHRAGQARVELRIGLARVELAQHHLRVRPRQLEHAFGQAPVLVLLGQRHARIARVADADHHVDDHALVRRQREGAAAGRARVEDRSGAIRQRPGGAERIRRRQGVAATDEARRDRFRA